MTFLSEITNYLPIITVITVIVYIVTLFMAYIYSGRIIFQRPSEITFTRLITKSAQSGSEIERDLIIIPISVLNTGARPTSFQVSLLVKIKDGEYFWYEGRNSTFYREPYAVLTNDFETIDLPYSEILKKKRMNPTLPFQDAVSFNYSTGFVLQPRESMLKICSFYPVNNDLKYPISMNPEKSIEMFLLYRKKAPSRRKVKKLRDSRKCDGNISGQLDSRHWKWRYGFQLTWKIPRDIDRTIRGGSTISVTRFEYHPFFLCKVLKRVPTLLMCEDV